MCLRPYIQNIIVCTYALTHWMEIDCIKKKARYLISNSVRFSLVKIRGKSSSSFILTLLLGEHERLRVQPVIQTYTEVTVARIVNFIHFL